MKNSSNARLSLARSIGVCLVILTLFGGVVWCFRSCGRETGRLATGTIEEFKDAGIGILQATKAAFVEVLQLTPQISVNNQIIVNQTSPIAELGVVSKEFGFKTHFADTWLHSEKTMDLEANFRVKAGFDLHESFRVTIEGQPPKARIFLPQPKILSCEMISDAIVDQSHGLWNILTAKDHQAALENMRKGAQQQAEKSSLREEAKAEIERKLRALLGDRVAGIAFEPAPMNLQPAKHE